MLKIGIPRRRIGGCSLPERTTIKMRPGQMQGLLCGEKTVSARPSLYAVSRTDLFQLQGRYYVPDGPLQ